MFIKILSCLIKLCQTKNLELNRIGKNLCRKNTLFLTFFWYLGILNKTSVMNSIKLTSTSKAYLKEFLDECAKRNEIDGLGLRRRRKKNHFLATFCTCFSFQVYFLYVPSYVHGFLVIYFWLITCLISLTFFSRF